MHDIDDSARTRALAAEDLNLVVALHALLATGSVTAAARRLGRTQSATSHALARLRALFGDPLLVRSGRGLLRTPRAEALLPDVTAALGAVSRLFEAPAPFEPRTSRRAFTLACPDLLTPFVPGLLSRLTAEAPRIQLGLETPRESTAADLGSGALDLALGVSLEAPGVMQRRLGQTGFVVVARRNHPALRGPWTVERWLSRPHVIVHTGNRSPNLLEGALSAQGIRREIGLRAPSFLAALHVAAATDFFFATPRAPAEALARPLGLVIRPLPVAMPDIPVGLFWHERFARDPGHAWLREHVAAEVKARL